MLEMNDLDSCDIEEDWLKTPKANEATPFVSQLNK